MGLKTKKSANVKLNFFWREVVLSDDPSVRQTYPAHEEIQMTPGRTTSRDLNDPVKQERS